MKLSFVLNAAGFTAESIETRCDITLTDGSITTSSLTTKAVVPGISAEQFAAAAADAKANCPVSKLLNCDITLDAVLA
jgi:osmotically inducible protein OsmC